MANRIQLRRDTAANWSNINPVLADGEPGLDIDANRIKYGDGSTAWNDLDFASGGSGLTFDSNGMLELTGNFWVGTWRVGDDDESVMWAADTAEYVGLWYGGVRDANLDYGPNVSITAGNISLDEPNYDGPSWDDGLQINFDIGAKNWHLDKDGHTNFPDNKLAAVPNNDFNVETSVQGEAWYMNFDGTSQSLVTFAAPLVVAASGTVRFTIQFFFKIDGDPSTTQFAFLGAQNSSYAGLSIYTGQGVGTPTNNTITVDASGDWNQQFTVPTMDNNWHHLIIVRDNVGLGSLSMWYDGVQVGAYNNNTAFNGYTDQIGGWADGGMYLNGSMAGLKISNLAEYNPAILTYPVPAEVPSRTNNTLLLLKMATGDTVFADSSIYGRLLAPGTNTGYSQSLLVPGTVDTYLQAVSPVTWNFSTGGDITLPNTAMIIAKPVQPVISGSTTVNYYNYDASNMTIYCQVNDLVNFPSFSGQILLNDHNTGQVELWLCGSGTTYQLGTSRDGDTPNNLGTIVQNNGIGGYTWTCASEGNYVFVATRTRSGA